MSVIGAGTMGATIAQVFAEGGWQVVLADQTMEQAQRGASIIKNNLRKMVNRGKITDGQNQQVISRICLTDQLMDCAGSRLALEAVYENKEAKQTIFRQLEQILDRDALLVSNTSSLSITEIGNVLEYPERFGGMHFFNPANVMKLVEVINGMYTSQETAEKIREIAEQLGKTPVNVEESAGFVVNRILIPMINEGIAVYAEGVSDATGIDTAMRLGANHPMGPLALGDLVGLDVVLAIMEVLHAETGDGKYRPHPLLRKMVRAGKLGRKTGEGFFSY